MTGTQKTRTLLARHVGALLNCNRCAQMRKPVVSGGPILSKVILVGQAPGEKEPLLKRPFAWTAGKTLFGWFEKACGISEEDFRSRVYMAAVCRCFPGKKPGGGDRVPSEREIANCAGWLQREVVILRPELIIPVGKLAIGCFRTGTASARAPVRLDRNVRLAEVIGTQQSVIFAGQRLDVIPLPHPSGASPWHRMEPGKTLLERALNLIVAHPAFRVLPHGHHRNVRLAYTGATGT